MRKVVGRFRLRGMRPEASRDGPILRVDLRVKGGCGSFLYRELNNRDRQDKHICSPLHVIFTVRLFATARNLHRPARATLRSAQRCGAPSRVFLWRCARSPACPATDAGDPPRTSSPDAIATFRSLSAFRSASQAFSADEIIQCITGWDVTSTKRGRLTSSQSPSQTEKRNAGMTPIVRRLERVRDLRENSSEVLK